jgi:hypothetical protein
MGLLLNFHIAKKGRWVADKSSAEGLNVRSNFFLIPFWTRSSSSGLHQDTGLIRESCLQSIQSKTSDKMCDR